MTLLLSCIYRISKSLIKPKKSVVGVIVHGRLQLECQLYFACCMILMPVSTGAQAFSCAEPIDGKEGEFEWGPKGLKPFDLPAPTAGGDVAAVKAGHVSISALRTGFIQPESKI